jgi:adenosylcobinamide-GDP ribazoletransferase
MADDRDGWFSPPLPTLKAWGRDIRRAAIFLTRVPLPQLDPDVGREDLERPLARAMPAFPLVGAAIGVGTGIVFAAVSGLGAPPWISSFAAVAAAVLVTGGLHEDGLADFADGLGAGQDRDDILDVMHDSRTGAYGVLALIFSVGVRAAALASLADTAAAIVALVAAASLSRAALPAAMAASRPARDDGIAVLAGQPEKTETAIAVVLGAAIALLVLGPSAGAIAILAAVVAGAAVMWIAERRIGGHTGDVLGAVQQSAETVVLAAVAAAASA